MLEETRNTITVPASFMLRMLASLNHIRTGDNPIGLVRFIELSDLECNVDISFPQTVWRGTVQKVPVKTMMTNSSPLTRGGFCYGTFKIYTRINRLFPY